MKFHSVLFRLADDEPPTAPGTLFFDDLHLDRIVDAIVKGKDDYNLRQLFDIPLRNIDSIEYRIEVMRDVEKPRIYELIASFATGMGVVREALAIAKKSSYPNESNRWVLDAAHRYCEEVRRLADDLNEPDVESRGLRLLHEWLTEYVHSEAFVALADEAAKLKTELARVEYCVLIGNASFTVRHGKSEDDLVAAIESTFERFRRTSTKSHLVDLPEYVLMNHIEAKVLDFVALLNPDIFGQLTRFVDNQSGFMHEVVVRFEREIQFYVACTDYARRFESAGLPTCFAQVSHNKAVHVEDGFDFALAELLLETKRPVVKNDVTLSGPERVLVVSGPNQGGKTTFARSFGQLHYLAALGCRVAARTASTFLFDGLFTHFEREEAAESLRGKLEDDIIRIREILEKARPDSIIILNEIFASTTAHDASVLAKRVMGQILELDALCVCVTFIDELASLSEKTVSLVSLVDSRNPEVRTYRIERRPANGLAYAVSLAQKHSLTCDRLRARLSKRSSA
jgi:DNA mismatch repair protein MutS